MVSKLNIFQSLLKMHHKLELSMATLVLRYSFQRQENKPDPLEEKGLLSNFKCGHGDHI